MSFPSFSFLTMNLIIVYTFTLVNRCTRNITIYFNHLCILYGLNLKYIAVCIIFLSQIEDIYTPPGQQYAHKNHPCPPVWHNRWDKKSPQTFGLAKGMRADSYLILKKFKNLQGNSWTIQRPDSDCLLTFAGPVDSRVIRILSKVIRLLWPPLIFSTNKEAALLPSWNIFWSIVVNLGSTSREREILS